MKHADVFSRKIRWLAVAVGLSAAASFYFWSPLAAFVPALLPFGALLQPRLPAPGKRIVKWLVWIWAFGWSQGLVILGFLVFNDLPRDHDLMVLRVSSLTSVLLILWLDIELVIDGVRRLRMWRSASAPKPRPVGLGMWIFAAALNLWIGWGLVRTMGIYHEIAGEIYALVLSMMEAAMVLAFDAYLVWRVLQVRRGRLVNVPSKD